MSAKGMRRCLAESGSACTMGCARITKALGGVHVAAGEAECAITQTVHFASSRELECWWAAKPYADTEVSTTQSHATGFQTDRMKTSPAEPWAECTTELDSFASGP